MHGMLVVIEMASSRMHGMIAVIAIVLSAMRTMNGAWIATNTSHFCEIANDCIASGAESAIIVDSTVKGRKPKKACNALDLYCNPSHSDNPDDMSSTSVSILDDKTAFCHIIISCHPMIDVSKWCPYAHFCNQPPSSHIVNDDNSRSHSCCVHCSCEPTCGHTNDCCYSHNASYNAIESEELKCFNFSPENNSIGLYMRDFCLNGSTCLYSREQIAPASSQEKQRIYINKECGLCNKAYDVIEWEILKICSESFKQCKPAIQVPETVDVRLIESYICSDKMIRTCDPRYRNEAVINLCHTVNAPVLIPQVLSSTIVLYANTFCVACNFQTGYDPAEYCDVFSSPIGTGPRLGSKTGVYTMLLDTNIERIAIQDHKQIPGKGDKCPTYMVKAIGQPGCRRIICPKEMVRVKDGSCQYYAKLWYRSRVELQVKLRPLGGVPVHASILRNTASKSNITKWMRSSCLSDDDHTEYVVSILTCGVSQEELVVEIVVQIRTAESDITPATFIPSLAKCFDHSWILVLGVKKYAFSPSIFPNEDTSIPIQRSGQPRAPKLRETIYQKVYTDTLMIRYIMLQKLFFCNQVELKADEWEQTGDQLRVLHNNITLGKAEFQNDDGQIRICFEDYQPRADSVDTVMQIRFSVLLTCILLVQIVHY